MKVRTDEEIIADGIGWLNSHVHYRNDLRNRSEKAVYFSNITMRLITRIRGCFERNPSGAKWFHDLLLTDFVQIDRDLFIVLYKVWSAHILATRKLDIEDIRVSVDLEKLDLKPTLKVIQQDPLDLD